MTPRLTALLKAWSLRDWGPDDAIFILEYDAIQYLGRKVYNDYEPAQFDVFDDRLDRWLHNVTAEADQQDLFRLLSCLFFVGRPEFESLCRAAHHGPVLRWLVDQLDADIGDPDVGKLLATAISKTWFCPITILCVLILILRSISSKAARTSPTGDLFGNLAILRSCRNLSPSTRSNALCYSRISWGAARRCGAQ